ncbi:autotransporter outer membrane beta-barrel domain-containing protein [Bordetella petrii]|uniref:autotransporter outer membrane beta-barrel domain-containing protein n=1 Tax=Bordetella petrii TaxID=94624 RepID=UPI001A965406|nr:autotransporter outer membrane beta-barrel domain-containing protein [Bordetella petrii]MBO1113228.1 autotransporter outer membrane beta-barrel domain-containing protein [Bordetella petrii]
MKRAQSDRRGLSINVPSMRQTALRVAIVSALGAGAWAGGAQAANCWSTTDNNEVPAGNYSYAYTECWGDDADDDDKTGETGPNVPMTVYGNFSADSTTYSGGTDVDGFSGLPGVVTAYSRGGQGYDEGSGGQSGYVTVTNYGNITYNGTTSNTFNSLIQARSLGGSGATDNHNNDSNGGTGGLGQAVSVTNSGTLTMNSSASTTDEGLFGIYALAAAGNGGDQNDPTLNYGEQLGGNGGNASTVTVVDSGIINLGNSSARLLTNTTGAAILAQSAGGQGGDNNGNAGTGGTVQVTHSGRTASYWQGYADAQVFGIDAMSSGGDGTASSDDSDNGGDGGGNSSGWIQQVTVDAYGSVLVDVANSDADVTVEGAGIAARALGGKGGTGPSKDHSGGNGGVGGPTSVIMYKGASVTTHGDNILGVVAQSIGGQGGDGGDGTALAGQGGGGGFGGSAGQAFIGTNAGTSVTTTGDFATALLAHSIGGGGGTGGDFVAVLGGQGGNGGNGGDAGEAEIANQSTLSTSGDHAYGMLAQSIAGSGGAGGVDTSAAVALGGDGAGGGTANQVTISSYGTITTGGYSAHGIVAQSIGGGGGAAGSANGVLSVGGNAAGETPSKGGGVWVTNTATVTTTGDAAVGLLAQSIGGGGGSGGDANGVVTVGGSGASAGDGGTVSIAQGLGKIQTFGNYSAGVLAQSVGGGGGNGGDTLSLSAGASLAIGGSGSSGGNGGSVCITNDSACNIPPYGFLTTVATHGNYAPGIIAQSVGGGGGNGGSTKSDSVESFIALQLGGKAGGGGVGNSSVVSLESLVATTGGAHSIGILSQSIGGGGGTGGSANYTTEDLGFTAAVVVGGGGGAGGDGGASTVKLTNSFVGTGMDFANPDIDPETYAPNDAFGILAQSIGGGGGSGGSSVANELVAAVPTGEGASVAFTFSAAVGGNGGSGGDACPEGDTTCATKVTLVQGTTVATLGDGSHGVVAQSIGGGGGNGGDASTLSALLGDADTLSLQAGMSLGGQGSAGGDGGAVNVSLGDSGTAYAPAPQSLLLPPPTSGPPSSTIITYGNYADGVLAQSIGGGGGNGGVGSSNSYAHGGPATLKVNVALGGTGGTGGVGGDVNITLNPNFTIRTLGSGSRGIVAQSIGGGGGASQGGTISVAGGLPSSEDGAPLPSGRLQVGLGATGGSGNVGGTVSATLLGAIGTEGGDADGVLLQSIGGGGGLGGSLGADASSNPILNRIGIHSDNSARLDETAGTTYTLGVDVGGTGGTGANGGEVDLTFAGQIATRGDWADGMVAQSIGGGGGAGGSATASGSKVYANATIGVGGTGGAAGNGGTVNFYFDGSHNNKIATAGYSAYGVLMQSIGGGGGQGADGSDQANGTITVGGSAGGGGGAGGNGGTIQVQDGKSGGWLTVATQGDESAALAMQSIGGGGGTGGAGNSSSKYLEQNSHAMQLSVGGNGGLAGTGGVVDTTFGTKATTQGDRAYGILAQSIGGGGGLAGAGASNNLTSVNLGGRNGASGDGNTVTVNLNAGSVISTQGAGAHGLIAQSIGGGGGIAGDTALQLQLDSTNWKPGTNSDGSAATGGSGDGNTVSVNVDGSITTLGANAYGIIAQSIGGGGGLGGGPVPDGSSGGGTIVQGFAGSTGGEGSGKAVTVTQAGSIVASGAGSTGIFAQSAGSDGAGAVTVNVNGSVTGGSGSSGYGVWVASNAQNVLNVGTNGQIIAGQGGVAVRHDGAALSGTGAALALAPAAATLAINNSGSIRGNVECQNGGGVACDLDNAQSGFLGDATLYQANIDNAGRVVIGKSGAFDTLTVTGDFTLQSGGILQADVDFERLKAPRMVVQGDTRLDGQVDVQPITLLPEREVTVATLEGDIQGAPSALDSAVIDYDARMQGDNVRVRAAGADFTAPSMQLSDNPRSVARHVQSAWDLGGNAAMAPLFAALDTASRSGADAYSEQLSDLSPGVAVAPAAQMQASMARFTGSMMSCPAFQGGDALTGEQDCLWGQVSGLSTDQDGDGGVSGFTLDGVTYQFGGQRQVSPGWFLGGSVAYENTHLRGDDGRVNGKGDSGYAGVVLKREAGPWTFSAGLGGGYGQYDIDRGIRIPGLESTASSDPDIYGASLRLRIARTFASDKFYLKPYLDLDALYTHMPSYSESGDAMHLDVESSNEFVLGLSPMLEVGGKVSLDNGATMRPFAYGGVSFLSKDEYTARARLQGAPDGTGSFETSLPVDDVIGRVGAGLQVSNAGGVDFRLQYDGEFSSHIQSHRASLKLMVPF